MELPVYAPDPDFDASTPGLPNFIYTDTTNLANLYTPNYTRDKLYSSAWHALEKETSPHACVTSRAAAISKRSLLEQYGIPVEKTAVVYAGSNIPMRDIDLERKDYGVKEILFVGVTWERKGGPDLVEAFKGVLQKHPDACLTIVAVHPKWNCPTCAWLASCAGRSGALLPARQHLLPAHPPGAFRDCIRGSHGVWAAVGGTRYRGSPRFFRGWPQWIHGSTGRYSGFDKCFIAPVGTTLKNAANLVN